MTSILSAAPDPAPIVACTISRDVQNFDLLIEDMEVALGEAWGDLGFNEAEPFFGQSDAQTLEFVAMAIDNEDEKDLDSLGRIIEKAVARGIKVILIAEDVSPAALHQLLRRGADEFVPYPLPEGELQAAIDRLRTPLPVAETPKVSTAPQASDDAGGVVFAVHGLAGGTGATTVAVNLAYELATIAKTDNPKVCILDLGLQFGSVATFLDLPRHDAIFELWSDTQGMDDDIFKQSLLSYKDCLWVLTAPPDMIPLDLITPDDVARVIKMAQQRFDYVVIDMPGTLVQWTETVLNEAHVYFSTIELDMRSAQNTLRLKRALQSEELPFDKIRFILNRAPKFTDLGGKARVKRMADSLEIGIELQFPDGGRQVTQASDHGEPLKELAHKNPLRREIAKLATSLHEIGKDDAEAA